MIVWISFLSALAWAIKDCIAAKSISPVKTDWKKYVGCAGAGLVYGFLSGLKFFQQISVIGVIALVGNSFNQFVNAITAVYKWAKKL